MRSHVQSRRHNTVLIDSIIIRHLDWHGGGRAELDHWTSAQVQESSREQREALCGVSNNTRKQRHLERVYSRRSAYRSSVYYKAEGEPKKKTPLGQRSFDVQKDTLGNFVQQPQTHGRSRNQ